MRVSDAVQEPDEHLRFAVYLDELRRVRDADEVDLVGLVLTDADQSMAQSAVLRHLDRRAADLCLEPSYPSWAESMQLVVLSRPFLTRRLREWSLLRAIALEQPWHQGDLLASSDWLQLKAAAASSTKAMEILAAGGRTKRIRNTARTGLRQRSDH
ncbi:hypothetical protein ACFY5C_33090 [Streptomyces sp. NPDC012935]|uniref:hypothetical protein n=1 Tax=Streptomyces sp. NPDC012935 TaxID=3364857 RepID=UPI003697AAF9